MMAQQPVVEPINMWVFTFRVKFLWLLLARGTPQEAHPLAVARCALSTTLAFFLGRGLSTPSSLMNFAPTAVSGAF